MLDILAKREKLARCQKWRKNITEIDWEEVYVPVQSWNPGGPRKLIKVPPEEAVAIKKENERIDEIYAQEQKWITRRREPAYIYCEPPAYIYSEKYSDKECILLTAFWLTTIISGAIGLGLWWYGYDEFSAFLFLSVSVWGFLGLVAIKIWNWINN